MDKKELYQKNQENFYKAVSLREPDWVPIGFDTNTWVMAYAGVPTYEAQSDAETFVNAKMKFIKELKPDWVTDLHCCIAPIKVLDTLGTESMKMFEDGYTIQHTMQGEIMREDEYEAFIADPAKFILNVLAPRKYSSLSSKENMVSAIKEAAPFILQNAKATQMVIDQCAEEGIIIAWNPASAPFHPLDALFDYHRGFKGLLNDLRRRPRQVLDACEALFMQNKPALDAYTQKVLSSPGSKIIPITGNVFHCVPYLSPAQFEKFWWPYFKRTYLPLLEGGATLFIKGEGKAAHNMKYFAELPRGTVILQPEEDDYYEVYGEYFKDKLTLCGGSRVNTLKFKSLEECKDEVKRAMDTFAPGGGYIYSNDRAFMGPNDVDANKLLEVYAFAREYGKY